MRKWTASLIRPTTWAVISSSLPAAKLWCVRNPDLLEMCPDRAYAKPHLGGGVAHFIVFFVDILEDRKPISLSLTGSSLGISIQNVL